MFGLTRALRLRGAGFLLLVLLCASSIPSAFAQPTATKTGGTSGSTYLFGTTSALHSQMLYATSDLAGLTPGMITSVFFRHHAAGVTGTLTNLTVRLGTTSNATFVPSTAFYSGLTTVFNGNFTIPVAAAAGDWFEIPLTTPFQYLGTQTLIVDVTWDATTNTALNTRYTTGPGSPSYKKLYSSSTTATTGTTSTTWQDFGARISSFSDLDLTLTAVTSPAAPFCPGSQPVSVTLTNLGSTTVTSATIDWQLNGVAQTPVAWAGSLAQFASTTVTLGSGTFTSSGNYSVQASVSAPNGSTDPNAANNTITANGLQTSLSGSYTIGGTAPDFATFGAARNALVARGVCGPVTFNVRPGTYNERVSFPAISGTNATNTVTFQSETLDSTAVILTAAATGTADNYMIELLDASYLTFRSLSMVATNASYGRVVVFNGLAQNIIFKGNIIQSPVVTSSSTNTTPVYDYSGAAALISNIRFEDNQILNGGYAMYMYGSSATALETGIVIRHNKILGWYYEGIYGYYQDAIVIDGNEITAAALPAYSSNYAVELYYCDNATTVTRNRINTYATSSNYNVYMSSCDGTASAPVLVANNFITSVNATGTVYGIYSYNGNYHDILFNTISVACGSSTAGRALYFNSSTSGAYGNVRALNNIAVNTGSGVAVEVSTGAVSLGYVTALNNNDYHVTGTILGRYNGVDQGTLAAWQVASSKDANSISSDPGFLSSTDLHVSGASLNGAGVPQANVLMDIDNEVRHATTPDIGADEFTPVSMDAGIVSIDQPVAPCPGTHAVVVTARNFGMQAITTVTVNWSLNGTAQTPYAYSGFIAPGDTVSMTIGSVALSAGIPYAIVAATSLPNGIADPNTSNDEASVTNLRTSLSGSYTIGGTTPDFATFADARDALVTNGVCGAVTFNVRSGVYSEHVSLPTINGASATNTITFQSEALDSTAVTLTYGATGTADNFVIEFLGASHVRIRKMSLVATGASNARVIAFNGNASDIIIDGNRIQGVNGASTSTEYSPIYNASGAGAMVEYVTIENNLIQSGSYSIYWYGSSSSVQEAGNIIRHNVATGFYYGGLYAYYQLDLKVDHNIFTGDDIAPYTTNYGLYTAYCDNAVEITRNRVTVYGTSTNYGLYLSYCDGASAAVPMLVANNFVSAFNATGTAYALYSYYGLNQDIVNNSFNLACGSTTAGRTMYFYSSTSTTYGNVRAFNNIAVNTGGGVAIEEYSSAVTAGYLAASNNNDLFATGTAVGRWNGVDGATIADWRTASAMDANSVSVDPGFTSPTDLHISTYQLNGVAMPHPRVLTDIDDEVRHASTPDVGADEFVPVTDDAGVVSIDQPVTPCPGMSTVEVTIRNFGLQDITTVTVNWSVNGIAQTPYSYAGLITPGNTVSATLGSFNFSAGVVYTITASTANPNGIPDLNVANDQAQMTDLHTAMSGTYTIGGTTPDFATFADAVTELSTYGVCGPVVFNVRTGMYPEKIQLNPISGSSTLNTVTFRSESGNAADVTMTYDASGTADNYVVMFNGADDVSFRNITMVATDPSYSRVVLFDGTCDNITIANCVLRGVQVVSTSTNNAIIYNTSGSGAMLTNGVIENNIIDGGSYSIYWYGSGTTQLETGTIIRNNQIVNFSYSGIYLYYQDSPVITGNRVRSLANPNTTVYGIRPSYCDNLLVISGNTVTLNPAETAYGLYVYYCDGTLGGEGMISNNMVTTGGSGTNYTLYSYYSNYQRYWHNSMFVPSNASSGSRVAYLYYGGTLDLKNNIFCNRAGGYAVYSSSTTNVFEMDYNNLYTTGTVLGYWGADRATLIEWQTATSRDAASVSRDVTFVDGPSGDLHLYGVSQRDLLLRGVSLAQITADIDGDVRNLPFMGADEGCYVPDGMLSYGFSTSDGTPTTWASQPGTAWMRIQASYPAGASTISVTVKFYDVLTNTLQHTATFAVQKLAGIPLNTLASFTLPSTMPAGYYRAEVVFNTITTCGTYGDHPLTDGSLLVVGSGQTPCVVWPGDVNNDGIVNYGDRKALNQYIFNANLRSTWLNGPARYRADAATNPLTYLTWEGQAASPWLTPDGCYMDADGNGVVNNYDQLAIKFNYLRSHGGWTPKHDNEAAPGGFELVQNYPNPFNPSTTLQFRAAERATVRLVVTDLLGREVAVLADGMIEAGTHVRVFDGTQLGSGTYLATITLTGDASGLQFTKTIRMTLGK